MNPNNHALLKMLHHTYIEINSNTCFILDEDEDEGEEIGEKEGQYFVDQATGQYYFQTTDGETMTVVSAPGIEEQG